MSGGVETCSEFFMAPHMLRLNIFSGVQVSGRRSRPKERQNCELECEGGGERHWREEAAVDGTGPVVETLAQDGSSMDREEQHERVDCYQRTYAQLGWSCYQDGPQRNLCENLEMPRPSMVEMETASLERSGERQMGWPSPTTVQNLQVGRHGCWRVSKFTGNADGLSESVQDNTGWLHLARNRGCWKQFAKCGKSLV